MIIFKNVTKKHANGVKSLSKVSFTIEEGEFAFIIGPSGAGKTTALRMIIREEFPTRGKIIIGEYEITNMPARFLPSLRRQIGVIFQDFKLLPGLTVAENISFILQISDKTDQEVHETVSYLLNVVNLSDRAHLYPEQLSGGEQQRVAIARAIANDPAIVLADEPTGNLDPENAAQVMDLLKQINDWGTTVVVSTHNPNFVDLYNGNVIALNRGKIVRDHGGKYYEEDAKPSPESKKEERDKQDFNKLKVDLKAARKDKKSDDLDEEIWEDLVEQNLKSTIFDPEDIQSKDQAEIQKIRIKPVKKSAESYNKKIKNTKRGIPKKKQTQKINEKE